MDDKELISQLHTVANTMRIRGMAGYAPEVEAAADRLRELVAENARLEKQYRERTTIPMENIKIVPATYPPIELDDEEPTP